MGWNGSSVNQLMLHGCCEALIKTLKSCLATAVGDAVMSFPDRVVNSSL